MAVDALQIFGLNLAQRADTVVFVIIAVAAAAVLLISFLLGEVFGAASEIGDFDDPSGGLLNIQTVAAFLAGFGATGWLLSGYFDVPSLAAAAGGIVGGMPMAGVVVLLTRTFLKQQVSTSFTLEDLVGHEAIVTLPVPPNGVGRVQYSRAGGTHTASARSSTDTTIAAGQLVTIRRVVAGTLLVEPLEAGSLRDA